MLVYKSYSLRNCLVSRFIAIRVYFHISIVVRRKTDKNLFRISKHCIDFGTFSFLFGLIVVVGQMNIYLSRSVDQNAYFKFHVVYYVRDFRTWTIFDWTSISIDFCYYLIELFRHGDFDTLRLSPKSMK